MKERFRPAASSGQRWLTLANLFLSRFSDVAALHARLAANAPIPVAAPGTPRQLLADVSVIVREDAGTGIQRVVRELLRQLLLHPPPGYEVRPVYATFWRGFRYADVYRARLMGAAAVGPDRPVKVRAGDIFLGMDLAGETLPYHHRLLGRWKTAGVKFAFIVYDLLPVLHPEWFTERSQRSYRAWIRTVSIFADTTACISRSVRDEFTHWTAATYGEAVGSSIDSRWFHLSGEMSEGEPPEADALSTRLEREASILMVGTVEPRKGHAQALAAFETLWHAGVQVNLVIAGRVGWKVRDLARRMHAHPEFGKRLIWLEDVSDKRLRSLFRSVTGVLAASHGEGFGLPIVEAARNGRPILARDIPVFREIAGEGATYFSGDAPRPLAAALDAWLGRIRDGSAPDPGLIPQLTWAESAQQLLANLPRD